MIFRRKGRKAIFWGGALAAFAALSAQAAAPPANVQTLTAAKLKQEMKKRKGKALLVNVWATWCPPCVASYPDLVKLHKKYAKQGLEVISISADNPNDLQKTVAPFLGKQNPGFPTFIIREAGEQEGIIKALDPGWYGDLPADILFGPDGKRVKTYAGEPNFNKIEQQVKQLLARLPKKQPEAH